MVAGRLMDRMGRRPTFLLYTFLAGVFGVVLFQTSSPLLMLPILCLAIFFGLGSACMTSAFSTELVPDLRAQPGRGVVPQRLRDPGRHRRRPADRGLARRPPVGADRLDRRRDELRCSSCASFPCCSSRGGTSRRRRTSTSTSWTGRWRARPRCGRRRVAGSWAAMAWCCRRAPVRADRPARGRRRAVADLAERRRRRASPSGTPTTRCPSGSCPAGAGRPERPRRDRGRAGRNEGERRAVPYRVEVVRPGQKLDGVAG